MKIIKARTMSKDKKICFVGFKNNEKFEIENRTLWSEIILREVLCDKCGDENRINFHTKDIPKLINILNKMLKLQKIQVLKWNTEIKGDEK